MGKVIDIRRAIGKKQDADMYACQADAEIKKGDFRRAELLYETAMGIYSEFMKPPVSLYERLSDCRLYMKEFSRSVRTLEDCLEKHPDNIGVLVRLGMMHIDQWVEIQDAQKSVKYFSRVKELNPEYRSRAMTISQMLAYAIDCSRAGNDR